MNLHARLEDIHRRLNLIAGDVAFLAQSFGSSVLPGSESALREIKPNPSTLWSESLERRLQQVRMAVFSPEYLAHHQEFTDEDQTALIDTIVWLWRGQPAGGPPTPDPAAQPVLRDELAFVTQEHKETLDRIAEALEDIAIYAAHGFEVRIHSAGGPPTPDPAAQLDSNKKTSDGLGSSVPPGSESALREEGPRESWNLLSELARVKGELDAANQHVKILEADRAQGQPAGGPPTGDLAADLHSNSEKQPPFYIKHRIGVYDYNSLVNCLRTNFKTAFPDYESPLDPVPDPQDIIQLMTAEIQNLRRQIEARRDNA
jgi:hypothetical protein